MRKVHLLLLLLHDNSFFTAVATLTANAKRIRKIKKYIKICHLKHAFCHVLSGIFHSGIDSLCNKHSSVIAITLSLSGEGERRVLLKGWDIKVSVWQIFKLCVELFPPESLCSTETGTFCSFSKLGLCVCMYVGVCGGWWWSHECFFRWQHQKVFKDDIRLG